MGFLPSHASDVSSSQRTKEMHSILLRLLFNPSYDLCSKINNYISQLRSAYSIGIQLRMGGQLSNMKDAVFLDLSRVKEVMQEVKQQARLMKPRRVIAFLSTDSLSVQEYVTRVLSPYITVLFVDDYQIGHSATTYGRKGKKCVWEEATKRAIMDLMILKECDLLFVTHNSSFGGFAVELQQSYSVGVALNPFLRKRGLSCSVFSNRKSVGMSRFVFSVF